MVSMKHMNILYSLSSPGYGGRKSSYDDEPTRSVQIMNPLKFWMSMLGPKKSKSRNYMKSKRRGPYDYSYRKNRYGSRYGPSYRTLEYDYDYQDYQVENSLKDKKLRTHDLTSYNERDPLYVDTFQGTFRKNKDFIEKPEEIPKKGISDFDFGAVFDKDISDNTWGEIHKPNVKSR